MGDGSGASHLWQKQNQHRSAVTPPLYKTLDATDAAGQRRCWALPFKVCPAGLSWSVTARAGSAIRLPETSPTRGAVSRLPWRFLNSTVERHRGREVLEVLRPILPPDREKLSRGASRRHENEEVSPMRSSSRLVRRARWTQHWSAGPARSRRLARFEHVLQMRLTNGRTDFARYFAPAIRRFRKRDARIVGRGCPG